MFTAGFRMSAPFHKVWNTLQPPRSGGSWLFRRCSMVPQSVETSSILNPSRRSRSAVTSLTALICALSVAAICTTFWPS